MKADVSCQECCVRKADGLLEEYQVSEEIRKKTMDEIRHFLETADSELSAPVLMAGIMSITGQVVDIASDYEKMKMKYNSLLLGREEEIWNLLVREEDPFLAALQYAVTGNYIDFGAMSEVKEEKLSELLAQRAELVLEPKEVKLLQEELGRAERLVYITDNAGEIVLDKVCIRMLKKLYPRLSISVIVRGMPTLNDATIEDAKLTGLCDLVPVIGNGTGIPGTPMDEISPEARELIRSADLCIAKGQGNFESLQGCGENIYYLFLCKCELFVKKFQVERFTPALINEKRIVQNT